MNLDEIKKDTFDRLKDIERATITKYEELGETLRLTLVIPLCKKYGMTYLSARGGQFHNGTDWILSFNDTGILEIREALHILSFYVGSDTIRLAYYVKDVTKEDLSEQPKGLYLIRFRQPDGRYQPVEFTDLSNLQEILKIDSVYDSEQFLKRCAYTQPIYAFIDPEDLEKGQKNITWRDTQVTANAVYERLMRASR